jgi:hypothetical protein
MQPLFNTTATYRNNYESNQQKGDSIILGHIIKKNASLKSLHPIPINISKIAHPMVKIKSTRKWNTPIKFCLHEPHNNKSILISNNDSNAKNINNLFKIVKAKKDEECADSSIMGTISIPIKNNQSITLNIDGEISTISIGNKCVPVTNREKQLTNQINTRYLPNKKPIVHREYITNKYKQTQAIQRNNDIQCIKRMLNTNLPATSRNTTGVKYNYTELLKPTQNKLNSTVQDGRISPSKAAELYKDKLQAYEVKEILHFSEIYYIGNISCKNTDEKWDDKKGYYNAKEHDHIKYRYEIVKLIGKGSFGSVYECIDHKSHTNCAIKMLRNKEKLIKQGEVESNIIKALSDSPLCKYFPHLIDSFTFRNHIVILSSVQCYRTT